MTLFLDTDTWVCRPLPEAKLWLDQHHFAIAHEPLTTVAVDCNPELLGWRNPKHYNSGVFAFHAGTEWAKFLTKWETIVVSQSDSSFNGNTGDQFYLNRLLWTEECPMKVLQIDNSLYNLRPLLLPGAEKAGIMKQVKILHGHFVHRKFWTRVRFRLTKMRLALSRKR